MVLIKYKKAPEGLRKSQLKANNAPPNGFPERYYLVSRILFQKRTLNNIPHGTDNKTNYVL